METILALFNYLMAVAIDGDYQNDWLTHLPMVLRADAISLGRAIAYMLGT